jgi:hypothetical protein
MLLLLPLIVVAWLAVLTLVIAMCRAAARADSADEGYPARTSDRPGERLAAVAEAHHEGRTAVARGAGATLGPGTARGDAQATRRVARPPAVG